MIILFVILVLNRGTNLQLLWDTEYYRNSCSIQSCQNVYIVSYCVMCATIQHRFVALQLESMKQFHAVIIWMNMNEQSVCIVISQHVPGSCNSSFISFHSTFFKSVSLHKCDEIFLWCHNSINGSLFQILLFCLPPFYHRLTVPEDVLSLLCGSPFWWSIVGAITASDPNARFSDILITLISAKSFTGEQGALCVIRSYFLTKAFPLLSAIVAVTTKSG